MDTSKVEDYGKLIGPNYKKRLEELNAGERVDMWGKKESYGFCVMEVFSYFRKETNGTRKSSMNRISWLAYRM